MKKIITFFVLSILLFYGCKTAKPKIDIAENAARVHVDAILKPAMAMQHDENAFYFSYTLTNESKEDIYQIEGKIFFWDEDRIVQEYGPVTLYKENKPLRPNYRAQQETLLRMQPFPWDGKKFSITILRTENKASTEKK